jgi:hypothetical protein
MFLKTTRLSRHFFICNQKTKGRSAFQCAIDDSSQPNIGFDTTTGYVLSSNTIQEASFPTENNCAENFI